MRARTFPLTALLAVRLAAADFEIKNEAEFKKPLPQGVTLQRLVGDRGFVEGPAWRPADQALIFSDIPNNELKIWTAQFGINTLRRPSNNSDGNTIDPEGRLVTAEHSGRRVSVTLENETVATLVDQYNGKKLNSPNDVVVRSDGTVWFTDPDYGLGQNTKEQEGNYVFRFDPKAKQNSVVSKDFDKPNGICFSPDENKLYVADSGKPRHIRVFQVERDGAVSNGKIFCKIDKGAPDGIRCDVDGRIWSSAVDGIQIFGADGALIGKILAAESPANLCFGGPEGRTLFITARSTLYSIPTLVTGTKRPGK